MRCNPVIIFILCVLMSVGCQVKVDHIPGDLVPVDVQVDGLSVKSADGEDTKVASGTTLRFMLFDINNVNLVTGESSSMSDQADGTGTYILSDDDTRTFRPCHLDDEGKPVLTDGKIDEDKKYSLRVSIPNNTNHAVLVSPGRMYSHKTDGTGRVIFPLDATKESDHHFYVSKSIPVTISDYRIYFSGTSLSPVFSKVRVNILQSPDKQLQQKYEIKDSKVILGNTSQKGDYLPNLQTVEFEEDSYDASLEYDSSEDVWTTGDIFLFAGNYTPRGLGSLGISFTVLVHAKDADGNEVIAEMPVNLAVSQILVRAGYYIYDVIWTSESVVLRLTTKDWVDEEGNDVVVDGQMKTQTVGEWTLDGNWIDGGGGATEI